MNDRPRRRRLGVTLTNVMAATAAVALAAVIAPPSLQQLHRKAEPAACANNLRVCSQAWNMYGNQFNGVWIAPWDNDYPATGSNDTSLQWPFTMLFYVTGHPITDGQPVRSFDGWWSTQGRGGPMYAGEFSGSPSLGPQLQCPTMASQGMMANLMWYDLTSYSYAIMMRPDNGTWRYDVANYPVPDLMTHASTTVHLLDLSGMLSEGQPNAWAPYHNRILTDPHSGKSNYLFADGHVELLAADETEERMWQDQWVPEPAAGQEGDQ